MPAASASASLPIGGGAMGAALRAHAWAASPLGPPDAWPAPLRVGLNLMLNSPESMFLAWGPDLRFFYNDGYRPMLGHRESSALGAPMAQVWSDIWAQVGPIVDRALAGEAVRFADLPLVMTRDDQPEETWWSFSYSPVHDEDGAVAGLFCVANETTQRVRSERAVQEGEARSRQIIDSAIDYAIIATDLDGRITRWNEGARRILGWTEEEMLGERPEVFFTPEDRADGVFESEMRAAVETGRGGGERWRLRKSGERFRAIGEVTPVRGADGQMIGFVKLVRDRTQDHLANEALRRSETRLRRAQEAGGVGVFAINFEDDLLYGSPEFCRIFGLPEVESLPARAIEALVIPDDLEVISNPRTRLDGVAPLDVEYRIRRADTGEIRCIARKAEYERDASGTPVRMVGVVQDVTDRRAAQRALEESAAKFQAFAQATPNHVWTATPEGRLDWANERAYAYSGLDETALARDGWEAWLHPEDLLRAGAAWAHSLATGEGYEIEFRIRRADGVYRWHLVRALPLRDEAGAIVRWIGANTDLEEQRGAREALAHLNATLEARVEEQVRERERIWRNSRDLLVVVGADGVFRAVNPAWKTILGHEPDQVVGRSFLDFVWPEDAVMTQGGLEVAAQDSLTNFENRYTHADGTPRWISWMTSREGELVYAYGRHVTDEKIQAAALADAQDRLRQSHKMEAVGQLTGGIAHDFNNLLTGVTGALDLVRRRLQAGRTDDLMRFMDAASLSAQRAAALTHRLLAFARRQTLDTKPSDVNLLVADMEDLLRRTLGEQVILQVRLEEGLWPAMADANQLENAILNLAINARDAMPDGGRLTIETAGARLTEADARTIADVVPGDYVAICVSDTGMGMTPEVLAKAFDPFFTTKPIGQGTGLGLSMIYGFAKQSSGHVRILSEVGKGTAFTLYLPRADAPDEWTMPAAFDAPRGKGETVLIVEDDSTVRLLVAEVLDDLGYQRIETGDALSAIPILRSERRIDLLVTDVGLPNMNGRQLAEIARETRPELKVLFITGYADDAATRDGLLGPGMEVLTKPFALDALGARIREMIER